MSLITCPECHQQVSDQAETCPYCGYPIKKAGNGGYVAETFDSLTNKTMPVGKKPNEIPQYQTHQSKDVSKLQASILSIVALVFSVLIPFIGLPLAIIDLKKKDDGYKHTLSIVAIIVSAVMLLSIASALSQPKLQELIQNRVYSNLDKNTWAQEITPIEDFEYSMDKQLSTIEITAYIGNNKNVWIGNEYVINGIRYTVNSVNGVFSPSRTKTNVESVIFSEGIEWIGSSTFYNAATIKRMYIPSTARSEITVFPSDTIFAKMGSLPDEVYYAGDLSSWHIMSEFSLRNENRVDGADATLYCNSKIVQKEDNSVSVTGEESGSIFND